MSISITSLVTIGIICVIAQFLSAFIAFHLGVREERYRWNELINKGIIPKPADMDRALQRTAAILRDKLGISSVEKE